jgi:hypothetical protein
MIVLSILVLLFWKEDGMVTVVTAVLLILVRMCLLPSTCLPARNNSLFVEHMFTKFDAGSCRYIPVLLKMGQQ